MRIVYLTTDEVNETLAMQLASESAIKLRVVQPRDLPVGEGFDALLYDLDYLPQEMRREALADLLAGPASGPVALHSYNLDEAQVEALRANGVTVSRYLEPALLVGLGRAASQVPAGASLQRLPAGRGVPSAAETAATSNTVSILAGQRLASAVPLS